MLRWYGLIGLLWFISCSPNTNPDPTDGGEVFLPDLVVGEGSSDKPVPCGNGTCPNENYQCCQLNKDAPAECCLKGYTACYSGGGGITGWPPYNGCNPLQCREVKPKHCPAGTRGTCCLAHEKCGQAWGIAFCQDESCPENRRCNGGKLCCSQPGICKGFKNVEYCDEDCSRQGLQTCRIQGSHYGDQSMHTCCPTDRCRIHPDGWPYCENDVF